MLAVHIIFIFIAMIGCYIIFSKKLNRFYIGATQQGMQNRLAAHNSAEYGTSHFTSTANDWELFLFIPTTDFAKATLLIYSPPQEKC